jgi:hypothetical protein
MVRPSGVSECRTERPSRRVSIRYASRSTFACSEAEAGLIPTALARAAVPRGSRSARSTAARVGPISVASLSFPGKPSPKSAEWPLGWAAYSMANGRRTPSPLMNTGGPVQNADGTSSRPPPRSYSES